MTKKLFSLLLAVAATSVGTMFASDTLVNGIWYDFNSSTKTATVTYRGSSYSSYSNEYTGDIVIPASVTYNNVKYSVTSIGGYAFSGCTGLTSVTIPNSVTSIGSYAFYYCTKLTSVTIPNSVTSIGRVAFRRCTGLTFIEIPNGVTSIGNDAFSGCTGLISITVPNSVTNIGWNAFSKVNNIVYFGAATGSPWGAKCVNGYIEGYLVYRDSTKTELLGCSSAAIGEIIIPNSVVSIGENAFYYCTGLTSVTVPNSVISIGEWAFDGCSSLNSIYAECGSLDRIKQLLNNDSRVKYKPLPFSISTTAQNGYVTKPQNICEALELTASPNYGYHFTHWNDGNTENPRTIELTQDTSFTAEFAANTTGQCGDDLQWSLADSILTITGTGNMWDEQLCVGPKESIKQVVFPQGITSIGQSAFFGCSSLTSIEIPNSVARIGVSAFGNCTSLTSVTIPNSITTIEGNTFSNCISLTSVNIPSNVTNIEGSTFYNCTGLTSIRLGSITSIGDAAFYGCVGLASIICTAVVPPTLGSHVFSQSNDTMPFMPLDPVLYVPIGSVDAYKSADQWKDFTNILPMETLSVESCGRYLFHGRWLSESGIYYYDTLSFQGFDSINVLILNIHPLYGGGYPSKILDTIYITKGEPVIISKGMNWERVVYPEENNYYNDTLLTIYGCDSIVCHHVILVKPNYTISTVANNAKYGSIEGAGTYPEDTTVTITAIPNKGYQFNQWSDGNTDNPRHITVTKDSSFTAIFGTKMCSWLVESNDLTMGAIVTTFEDEFYKYGTQITVEASPNSGYKFVKWNDGKKYNPYKFSILDDKYLLAIFMEAEEEPDTTSVQLTATTATFSWTMVDGGKVYTITIYLDAACTIPLCAINFNENGQLISIVFSNHAPRRTKAQEDGFTYTVAGLDSGTTYFYKVEAKDEDGKLLNTDEGSFKTTDDATFIDQIINDNWQMTNKIIKDGQLLILRGDKIYTVSGQEVK